MSTAPFTDEERNDIMRFLGYPNWRTLGPSIQLGYPAASQPLFLVIDSMDRLAEAARPPVREHLCELRAIECQMGDARKRMKTDRVEGITMNRQEAMQLRQEYAFWQKKLADLLGVWVNCSSQLNGAMPGGLNARVSG